jgi:outer membrane lipoprotein-sorting protein
MDIRTITDEICRMEPDAASVERVIVRALGIPSACDAPAAGEPRPRFWKRIPGWTRVPRMRRGLAYAGVGIAAALLFFVLWATVSTASLSAMEKMAEKIRAAKSFKATIIGELREAGKPQVVATGTVYWLAPGSCRVELKRPRQGESQEEDSVDISPAGKPGIFIDHLTKEFQRSPAHLGPQSPLWMFDQLSRFSGDADRKLGEKNVGGAKAWGFEIDAKKIDPDSAESTVEIWIDAQSNLPISVCVRTKTAKGSGAEGIENFQWNIDLDPKLFAVAPPAGYREGTVDYPSPEKLLQQITLAFRTYAELCGKYPAATRIINNELREEMRSAAAARSAKKTASAQVMSAWNGLALFNWVLDRYPDAMYYGKTVRPGDKDKVLARWKLGDGRYQVIYGDLRAETVAAESLRALEKE